MAQDQSENIKNTIPPPRETPQTKNDKGGPVKYRLDTPEIITLLIFAIIFDVLSIIPGINVVVVIVGQSLMALFLLIFGVGVFSGIKKSATYIGTWVIEAIPALSAIIPTFILQVFIIVLITRFEDKTGVNVGGIVSGKSAIAQKGAKVTTGGATAKSATRAVSQGGDRATSSVSENTNISSEGVGPDAKKGRSKQVEFGTGELLASSTGGHLASEKEPEGEDLIKMADEYDRTSQTLRLGGHDFEAEQYRIKAGELRKQYEKQNSDTSKRAA